MVLIVLAWVAALPLAAQSPEAWPPKPPHIRFQQAPDPQTSPALHPQTLEQGLGAIAAQDLKRLGAEAKGAQSWGKDRKGLSLKQEAPGWALRSDSGDSLALSEGMGRALSSLDEYFSMTQATLAKPITHEELKAALLCEAGVASLRALFESMIDRRVKVGDKPLVPEAGGEAALTDKLELREMRDPAREAFRSLSKVQDQPEAMAQLYREHPEGMQIVDPDGLLKRFLEEWPEWERKNFPPKAQRERLLRMRVSDALRASAATHTFDPLCQLEAIVSHEWSGRYVGFWHAHPPHFGEAGWSGEEEPTYNDMELAREQGQNLTIAFHPDGFDAYDLSPLAGAPAPDLSRIKKVSYRSADWRRRFQDLHAELRKKP